MCGPPCLRVATPPGIEDMISTGQADHLLMRWPHIARRPLRARRSGHPAASQQNTHRIHPAPCWQFDLGNAAPDRGPASALPRSGPGIDIHRRAGMIIHRCAR